MGKVWYDVCLGRELSLHLLWPTIYVGNGSSLKIITTSRRRREEEQECYLLFWNFQTSDLLKFWIQNVSALFWSDRANTRPFLWENPTGIPFVCSFSVMAFFFLLGDSNRICIGLGRDVCSSCGFGLPLMNSFWRRIRIHGFAASDFQLTVITRPFISLVDAST